ncbi:hypothetical protein VAEU17_4330051 [Vibrio aestuarianus]|nr:hypothetical protein VAEU17_4330051 [Vibrio aestuarianus]
MEATPTFLAKKITCYGENRTSVTRYIVTYYIQPGPHQYNGGGVINKWL